jgi:chlorobactene glucosyltransferase
LFLLFMPFPFLIYSVGFFDFSTSFSVLLISSLLSSMLVYIAGIIDAKKGLQLQSIYSIFAPVGSFIVIAGFFIGIIQAKSNTAVSWRGRTYSMKEHVTDSISV